jgi:endonuclease/exonuclease/phosphatase family metal-dependent hydrolase
MRIATFNVQNLRLRRWASGLHLDGARDGIVSHEISPEEKALDALDRELTARLIARSQADVIALQEVFDSETLDYFHDAHLAARGEAYPHRFCVEGNDGRRRLALLSRHPLSSVQSHAQATFADIDATPPATISAAERVFRRDCLQVECGPLALFVCHFKARTRTEARDRGVRSAEALAVRRIIERRFDDPANASWLVLGDFNVHDEAGETDLAILTRGFAVDLGERLPEPERWTYFLPQTGDYSRPDRLLASPALAANNRDSLPAVYRMGVSRCAVAHSGERFSEVGPLRPRASDHALLSIDLSI